MVRILDLIILYIIYKLFNFSLLGKIMNVILPFLIAFVLAYSFYPLQKKLNKKVPKVISVLIIIILLILFIVLSLYLIIPILYKETNSLINIIIYYSKEISLRYNLSFDILNKVSTFDYKYLIEGVNISINYITKIVMAFISFIYFLIDMDRIELYIKKTCNKKIFNYFICISNDVRNYMNGLIKICIISFFEYGISFLIIGHKDYLLMGFIGAISNLIPYFGAIFVLIIGILTAPSLVIRISILYLILSNIDGYIINPYVYGKSNKIHPIVNLVSISIGGALLGIKGILLSLPLTIIIITTFKYFKNDIYKYLRQKIINKKLV